MKKILLLCASIFAFGFLSAQDSTLVQEYDTVFHKVNYRATIIQKNGAKEKGWLAKVSDEAILLANSSTYYSLKASLTANSKEFATQNVDIVLLKKHGRIGRGILWGSLAGAALGGILVVAANSGPNPAPDDPFNDPGWGWLSTAKPTAAENVGMVLLPTITGAIIGGVISALIAKEVTIHGKSEKMRALKEKMNKKCFDLVPIYKTR